MNLMNIKFWYKNALIKLIRGLINGMINIEKFKGPKIT